MSTTDYTEYTDVRVKFGPRPNQTLPLELAEAVLTALRDRFPIPFGEEVARGLVGPDAVKAKRNGARAG